MQVREVSGSRGTLAPLMRSRHPIYRLYLYISRYTCTRFNTSAEQPREHLLCNCCAYQLVIALTPPFISTDYYRVHCTRLFIDLLLNLLLLFNIHIDSKHLVDCFRSIDLLAIVKSCSNRIWIVVADFKTKFL